MDLGLDSRTYVVTGASRGLGRATAAALLAEGANVVATSREPEALSAAVDSLVAAAPGRVVGIPFDLADEESAEKLAATAVARFGGLDGALVNGPSPAAGTALQVTDVQWRLDFEAVVLGTVRLVRAVASAASPAAESGTRGTGGSIALVLSASARQPQPGLGVSNALRPGLGALVTEWADELGPRGIRVNGLLPGRLATDRVEALDAREGPVDVVRRRYEQGIPLGRYGDPEEFARVAAFVLSPAASYVNGTLIAVDGGLLRSS